MVFTCYSQLHSVFRTANLPHPSLLISPFNKFEKVLRIFFLSPVFVFILWRNSEINMKQVLMNVILKTQFLFRKMFYTFVSFFFKSTCVEFLRLFCSLPSKITAFYQSSLSVTTTSYIVFTEHFLYLSRIISF